MERGAHPRPLPREGNPNLQAMSVVSVFNITHIAR